VRKLIFRTNEPASPSISLHQDRSRTYPVLTPCRLLIHPLMERSKSGRRDLLGINLNPDFPRNVSQFPAKMWWRILHSTTATHACFAKPERSADSRVESLLFTSRRPSRSGWAPKNVVEKTVLYASNCVRCLFASPFACSEFDPLLEEF
jgi:hypothetical protein